MCNRRWNELRRRNPDGHDSIWGYLLDDMWHTWGTFLNTGTYEVRSLPARLIVISFALFIVVILATYTANLAAFLTAEKAPQARIRSVKDLQGSSYSISTVPTYVEMLRKDNIVASAAYGALLLLYCSSCPSCPPFGRIRRGIMQ